MLIIAGTVRVQPEDRDVAIAAMTEMMAETAKEEGCVSYDFSADLSQPELFHLFEEWETDEHLAAHFVAPHMAVFQEAIGNIGEVERSIFKYDVSGKNPL